MNSDLLVSPVAMCRGREVRFEAERPLSEISTLANLGVFAEYLCSSFSDLGEQRGLSSTWSGKATLFREALLSLFSQGGG